MWVGSCTELCATAYGVSSAVVSLNDVVIFDQSDFHNKDQVLCEQVSLESGENTLDAKLTGSPGDKLVMDIYDCSKEPKVKLYETTALVRDAGPPNTVSR
ncbi:MAG TPA: hypothetical protein VI895_04835 [Bdellovibrionota bacterium]|nr:hypothetical protein [Bdellovibrionota bacterium]